MKKGPQFEKAVVEFLRSDGWTNAERRVQGGSRDAGDVAGIPNVCLEIKNTGVMEMGRAMAECEKEAVNAKASFFAVIFKRRQKPVEASYVVMTLEQWSRILRILGSEGWLG